MVIAIPFPSQLLMFTRGLFNRGPPDPWLDDVRLDELSKSMDVRLLELEKSSRAAVPWHEGDGWIGQDW